MSAADGAQIDKYWNSTFNDIPATFCLNMVDEVTVYNLIMRIKSRAVGCDRVSMQMLKLLLPQALPYVTHIINSCIECEFFPSEWKDATVLPLPKVENPVSYKDLRPISILPSLSKVLEKIIDGQLREHLSLYNIIPECQSGFIPGKSCSTTLLKVTDDILRARDDGKCSILVLLDYSKAFDTVDHELLLSILHYIGCSSSFIATMRSYLSGRRQCVKFSGEFSEFLPITRGVPQGAILSPLIFNIYTFLLPEVIKTCNIMMYADDTQLCHSFSFGDHKTATDQVNADLDRLLLFSKNHSLTLNPTKSTVMVFGRDREVDLLKNEVKIRLGSSDVSVVTQTKDLGLVIDNTFRYHKAWVSLSCLEKNKREYAEFEIIVPIQRCL